MVEALLIDLKALLVETAIAEWRRQHRPVGKHFFLKRRHSFALPAPEAGSSRGSREDELRRLRVVL